MRDSIGGALVFEDGGRRMSFCQRTYVHTYASFALTYRRGAVVVDMMLLPYLPLQPLFLLVAIYYLSAMRLFHPLAAMSVPLVEY